MSVSQDRVDANRENAQHSTGPRTEEGKRVSSLNALRHGFNSSVDVLPGEDMKAYLGLHKDLFQTWQPTGYYETYLIKRLTSYDWRLGRCGTLENGIFAVGHAGHANDV